MLPGKAIARLDIRVVPDFQPTGVLIDLVQQPLRRRGFDDIEVSFLAGVTPDRCPLDAPIVEAVTAYPMIPAYSASHVFHQAVGTPVIFAGAVTHVGSNLHGPNENIRVADYVEYIKCFGRLIARLGSWLGVRLASRVEGMATAAWSRSYSKTERSSRAPSRWWVEMSDLDG